MASLLKQHQDAVQRLAEVPGLGPDSAQQIITEVGATVATFGSSKNLSSWVGARPGDQQSAGMNKSTRCPTGNRQMRRIPQPGGQCLGQAQRRHLRGRVSPAGTASDTAKPSEQSRIGFVDLIWIILNQGVSYEERGEAVSQKSKRRPTSRMIRELRSLGYEVQPLSVQTGNA
jgi:hypothetical protein